MLIEDANICQTLEKIVSKLTLDSALRDDLMQECLIRLWKLEKDEPGRTRSWYLQNCRFHLQHWLDLGRSLDSPKRAGGDCRVTIDGVNDELPAEWYHTNGELLELVSARDIVSTLACHLKPSENAVLGGLADGLVLNDIADKLKMSYPTALKYRRKIAALSIKLGILRPPTYKKEAVRVVRRTDPARRRHAAAPTDGVKHIKALANILRASVPADSGAGGRMRATDFRPVLTLATVESIPAHANGGTAVRSLGVSSTKVKA
jgi:DNA-directed RNA polymerase specialized sigma24 family protein